MHGIHRLSPNVSRLRTIGIFKVTRNLTGFVLIVASCLDLAVHEDPAQPTKSAPEAKLTQSKHYIYPDLQTGHVDHCAARLAPLEDSLVNARSLEGYHLLHEPFHGCCCGRACFNMLAFTSAGLEFKIFETTYLVDTNLACSDTHLYSSVPEHRKEVRM